VITASLNQAQFLERAILSVLDQDYPDVEYIVVDGGSSDGSVEILERYDSRIARWVSEPDRGQAHAINKGLSWTTGDLVGYINSDDYYLPGMLRQAATLAEPQSVRWCAGRCRYENADGTLDHLNVPSAPHMPRRRLVHETWYVPQASSIWKRDVFDEVGLLREDLHYVFDLEFGLRCALRGIVPTLTDETWAVRYLHGDAKSADPAPFAAETKRIVQELDAEYLTRLDVVPDVLYRTRRRLRRERIPR